MAVSAPTERKVVNKTSVSSAKGGNGGGGDDVSDTEEEAKKGGKLKLIIILVVVLAIAGGAAYFFLLKPSGAPAKPAAPKPGTIVSMDATTLNLQDGHYLKLQVAMQLIEGKTMEDTTQAANDVIDEFSNHTVADVATTAQRDALKKDLIAKLNKDYKDVVYDVFFMQFVTQ